MFKIFTSDQNVRELKVRVLRGYNLAVRDVRTSDPYVIVSHKGSKKKTRVIGGSLDPEWNEDLIFLNFSPHDPLKICVFDKDTLTRDDTMGDAIVNIAPLMEAATMNSNDIPEDNSILRTVIPNCINRLATESRIYCVDGKVLQDIIVRLNNVECGELQLQLQLQSTTYHD